MESPPAIRVRGTISRGEIGEIARHGSLDGDVCGDAPGYGLPLGHGGIVTRDDGCGLPDGRERGDLGCRRGIGVGLAFQIGIC